MFVHLLQAIVIAVLFMFPFVYDVNDFTTNHKTANICATVDSALVKYYSQTGILPQKLDAETLKKLGLDEKSAEGMTYEKLEDRKFVLSYEDAKDNVNESIHSRTLLPINVNTNFGVVEDNEKYYWLELPESPNQTVTVDILLPDGSKSMLNEGERKEFPVNSKYQVTILPDNGYNVGSANPSSGVLINDVTIEISDAIVKKFLLMVSDNYKQNVIIDVNDINNNRKFSLKQGESTIVAAGAYFKLKSIIPVSGYMPGSVIPEQGYVYEDTTIKVENGKSNQCSVVIEDSPHQTIKVKILNSINNQIIELKGGNGSGKVEYIVGYNSKYKAEVIPEDGYMAGILSLPSEGFIKGYTLFSVTDPEDVPVIVDDPKYHIGDGWHFIHPRYVTPDMPYYDGHLLSDEWFQGYGAIRGVFSGKDGGFVFNADYARNTGYNDSFGLKIPEGVSRIVMAYSGDPQYSLDRRVCIAQNIENNIYWYAEGPDVFYENFNKPPYNFKLNQAYKDFWYPSDVNLFKKRHPAGLDIVYSINVTPGAYYKIKIPPALSENGNISGHYRFSFYYNRRYQNAPFCVTDLK